MKEVTKEKLSQMHIPNNIINAANTLYIFLNDNTNDSKTQLLNMTMRSSLIKITTMRTSLKKENLSINRSYPISRTSLKKENIVTSSTQVLQITRLPKIKIRKLKEISSQSKTPIRRKEDDSLSQQVKLPVSKECNLCSNHIKTSQKQSHQTVSQVKRAEIFPLISPVSVKIIPQKTIIKTRVQVSRTKVAITGSAGNNTNIAGTNYSLNNFDLSIFDRMVTKATALINKDIAEENIELISGGSAWSDHVAIQIYLNHKQASSSLSITNTKNYTLSLYLPEDFDDCHLLDTENKKSTIKPVSVYNNYHTLFSKTLGDTTGLISRKQIQMAIKLGARIYTTNCLNQRNSEIAQAQYLYAFTWQQYTPTVDAAADTWKKAINNRSICKAINLYQLVYPNTSYPCSIPRPKIHLFCSMQKLPISSTSDKVPISSTVTKTSNKVPISSCVPITTTTLQISPPALTDINKLPISSTSNKVPISSTVTKTSNKLQLSPLVPITTTTLQISPPALTDINKLPISSTITTTRLAISPPEPVPTATTTLKMSPLVPTAISKLVISPPEPVPTATTTLKMSPLVPTAISKLVISSPEPVPTATTTLKMSPLVPTAISKLVISPPESTATTTLQMSPPVSKAISKVHVSSAVTTSTITRLPIFSPKLADMSKFPVFTSIRSTTSSSCTKEQFLKTTPSVSCVTDEVCAHRSSSPKCNDVVKKTLKLDIVPTVTSFVDIDYAQPDVIEENYPELYTDKARMIIRKVMANIISADDDAIMTAQLKVILHRYNGNLDVFLKEVCNDGIYNYSARYKDIPDNFIDYKELEELVQLIDTYQNERYNRQS